MNSHDAVATHAETTRTAEEPDAGRAAKRVFVSYSRSEAPLVDDLADRLEADGFDVWLDYRSMVPGRPWNEQLADGIRGAEAVVLVISRRSIAGSKVVQDEIEQARAAGVPIVLAIVEASPLPEELSGCAWVDMRRGYTRAVAQLSRLLRLEEDEGPRSPPPQKGFRAPLAVWLTAGMSALVVPVSIVFGFWTVVLPYVLVPLPFRVLRRNFHYPTVRTALVVLPWAGLATVFASEASWEGLSGADVVLIALMILAVPALFLMLRSRRVRRWMKPSAARPILPVYDAVEREPQPTTFAIDAAPEDAAYAEPIELGLSTYHERAAREDAGITLRLISRFNDTAEIAEGAHVLPVLIQDPDDELPPRLRRTQWIDLRRGIHPRALDGLARLLDDPRELLRRIGVAPPHDQLVMPPGVFALYLSLWTAILAPVCAVVIAVFSQVDELHELDTGAAWEFLLIAAFGVPLAWRAKNAIERRTPNVRYRRLLAVIALIMTALLYDAQEADYPEEETITGALNAAMTVFVPAFFLPLIWAVYAESIERWLPARTKGAPGFFTRPKPRLLRLSAALLAGMVLYLSW